MSEMRTASCTCGQLSLTTRGDPVRVGVCHCLACQRRTGSPFGQQARWRLEDVSPLRGRAVQYRRIGDDGGACVHDFCPECGATVRYIVEDQPDLIAVPIGAFADPHFPAPQYSSYGVRRHAWVVLPLDIEHWD
ncbi:MAG: aldehyde-activating protein [Alphaproteobacteria bacterium]|nr:aldehyde-activating protein [Alphaproteobacteria bacterium]